MGRLESLSGCWLGILGVGTQPFVPEEEGRHQRVRCGPSLTARFGEGAQPWLP